MRILFHILLSNMFLPSSKFKSLIILCAFLVFSYKFNLFKYSSNKNILSNSVLYLSLHQGTIDEIVFAFERKNIGITVINLVEDKRFDIKERYGYSISDSIANKYIKSGLVKELCDKYDLIIIGDTIPMGRPFFQASKTCKAKLALQITNRFDYNVAGSMDYIQLMQNLVNNHNVFWLPNNDFELFYLNHKGIYPKSSRTLVIKPYGVSNVKKKNVTNKKTIIYSHFGENFLKDFLNSNKISNSKYKHYKSSTYGGPLTLSEHNLFIYFPYQFSTMKVFQNLNYGVLVAIPTSRFFKEIINRKNVVFEFNDQIHWFINNFENWTYYFDVYNPAYTNIYLKFDNWNEFIDLINKNVNISLRELHLNKIEKKMNFHYKENDMKWEAFFSWLINF